VPTASAAVVAPAAAPAPAVLGGQATTKPELASEPGARAGLARAVPTSVAPSPLAATDAIRATEALTSLAQGAAEQVAPAVVAPSSELAQAAAAAQLATAAPSAAMAPDVAVAQQPSFARTTPDAPATALPHLATDVATAATAAVAETAAGGGAKAEIGAAAQWLAADLASAATSAGLPSADAVATAAIAPAVHAVSPAAATVSSAAAVAQAGAAVARAAIAPTVPVATADIAVMLAETTRSAAQPAGTALAASQAGSPAQEAGLQTWAAAGAEARGIAAAMSQPVFASRVGRTALQWADAAMTRWAPESTRDQSPSVRSMAFVDRIAALWMSMSTSQRAAGLQRLSSVVAAQAGERSVDNVSWLFPRPWFQDELDWLSASRAGQTAGETIFTTRGTYAAAAAQGLRAPALFDYIAPSFARASSDHGPETFAAPAAAGPYSSLVPLSAVSAAALLSRSIHEIHSAQALARGPLDSAGAVWTAASMQVPVLAGSDKERSSGDASESMRTLVALVGSLIPDSELARFGSQMIQTLAAQPAAPGAGDGAKLAHDSIVQMQSRAVAQALAHAREQLSAHMQRSAREARERVVPDAVADRSIAVPIGGSLDRAVSSVDDPEATTESMMSFIHHDEIRNEITRQERHRADNTKSATVRARASARLQARIDILVAEQIARLEQAAALAPSSSLESVRGLEASAAAVIEDAGFNEIQVQAWRQVLRMAELLAHSAAIGPSAMAPVAGPRLAMPTGLGGLIAAMHTAASVDRTRTAPRDSSLAWQPAPWPRTFAVADESERFTGAGRATATGLRSQWPSRPLSPMAPTSSTLAAIAAQAPVALGHLAWVDRWLGRFAGASESALATMGAASMRAQLAPQQPVVSATAEHEGLTTQRSSAVEAAISQSAASLPRVLPLTTSVPRSAGATPQPWSHPTLDSSTSSGASDALRFADDDVVSDDVFAAIASGTTTRRTGSTSASNSGVTTGARSIASTKVPENAPGNAPGIGSTIAAALAAARVRDLEVVTARDAAASPADVVARTAPTAPVNAGLSAALAASPMAAVLGHVLALPRAAVFDPRSLAGSELAVAFLAGALSAPMVTQFVTDAVASMSTASSAALELATTSPWRQWSAELVQPAEQSRAAARVESAQRARLHEVSLDRVTSAWATESGSRLSTAAAAASASSLAVSDVAHTHGAMPAALPATLDLGSAAAGTAPRWRSAAPTTAPEVGSVATGAVGERSTSPVGVVVGALDALDGPHAPHAPDASTQVSAALRPAAEVVAAPAGAAGGHGIVTLRSMLLSPASPRQQRLAETFGTSSGWANRESAENLPVAYQTLGELLREAAVDPSAWSRRTSASQPPRLATDHAGAALLAAGRPGAWPLGAAADVESASAMAGSSSEHYAEFLTRSSAQRDLPLLVWPLAGGAPAGALIQLALAASLPAGFSASLPSAAAAASHASTVLSGAVAASRSATAALPGALSVAPPPSSLAPVRLGGGLGSDLGAPASGATTAAARPALRTALETIAARDQLHSVQAQRELLTASSDSGGRGLRGSMDRGASSPGMLAERALAFGAAQSMQSADLSLDFVAPELVLAARMYGFGAVEAAQAARLAIGGATGLSMMAGAVDLRFVSQAVRSGLLDGVAATQRSAALAPSALAPDSQRGPVSSPITPGSPLAASPGWGGQQAHRLDDAGDDGAFGVNRRVPRGAFLLPEASVAAMGLVAALPDGEFAMPVAALEILAAKMVAEMGNLAVPERAATASQHPPSQAMHARAAQVESALAGVLSSLAAGPVAGPAATHSDISSDARIAAASTIARERDLSFDRAPLERAMVAEVVGAGSPGSEALAQAIASIEPSRRAGFEARFRSLYAAFAASPDAASMSPAVRAARALAFAHQDQDSLGLSPKERAALAWNMVPIVVDGGQAGEGRGEGRGDRSDNDRSGTGSRSGEFGRRAERAANSMAGAASVTETAGRRAGRNAPELTAVQGAEAAEESSGLRAAPSSRPGMRRLSARAGEALSSFVTSQATDSQPSAGSPQQSGGRSWKSGRFGGGEVEIPSWFESASRRMFADRTEVGGFAISDLTLVASTPRTQVAAASRDSAAAPAPKEASADGTTKSGPRVDIPKVAHEVYNEVQQIMRSARNRNGAPFL
jgi:trimeric autotransporter adhesin